MKNTYRIDIAAPPARVFELINESDRLIEWVPNLIENERLEVTEAGVGSTFRQVYLENGRRMEMEGEVTRLEPDRRLECEIRGKPFDLVVDYELEDLGAATRLTQRSEVRFNGVPMKIIGALMSPFMKKAARRAQERSFAKLKALAESSP